MESNDEAIAAKMNELTILLLEEEIERLKKENNIMRDIVANYKEVNL